MVGNEELIYEGTSEAIVAFGKKFSGSVETATAGCLYRKERTGYQSMYGMVRETAWVDNLFYKLTTAYYYPNSFCFCLFKIVSLCILNVTHNR